jgi:hypothetical protein
MKDEVSQTRKGWSERVVAFVFGAMVLLTPLSCWGANEDARAVGGQDIRMNLKPKDQFYVITFSTTIPANTDVLLLGDHGVSTTTVNWPSGITFSTSPARSNGGRSYLYFQAIEGQTPNQKLHWNYGTSVSTNTSPYLTEGQGFPPATFPFVWQSSMTVRSTGTFKVGGFIMTEKSRR